MGDIERGEVVVREWGFHSTESRDRTVLGQDQRKGMPIAVGSGAGLEVKKPKRQLGRLGLRQLDLKDCVNV